MADFVDPTTDLVSSVPGKAHFRVFYGEQRVVDTPIIQLRPFSYLTNHDLVYSEDINIDTHSHQTQPTYEKILNQH